MITKLKFIFPIHTEEQNNSWNTINSMSWNNINILFWMNICNKIIFIKKIIGELNKVKRLESEVR